MTRPMTDRTKQCGQPPAASTENVKPVPFLLLPPELRNVIYRYDLPSYFLIVEGGYTNASPFGSQPAITRVNKQVRAEALSIYYGEIPFRLNLDLSTNHCLPRNWHAYKTLTDNEKRTYFTSFRSPDIMGYVDFCRTMTSVIFLQRQTPGYQDMLRHVRNLTVYIAIADYGGRVDTWYIFKKRDGEISVPCRSSIGYDMNWADLEMVSALVQAWMEKPVNMNKPAVQQERLINVLWLLGMNLRSD